MLTFLAGEVGNIAGVEPSFAKSRDSAVAFLREQSFDLVVLDLKIPSTDGALDADENHGLAIHSAVHEHNMGTPVVIFSAFGSMKLLKNLLKEAEMVDVFGSGVSRGMTLFNEKTDLVECLEGIRAVARECVALADIEISFGTAALDLSEDERRVLRILARGNGGKHLRVAALGGGLSGARTCRVEVQDANSVTSCYAVAKLADIRELDREHQAYKRFVAPSIKIAGFPHVIGFIRAGAGNLGGLFYGLAAEHDTTLLDALKGSPETSGEIVDLLEEIEVTWQKGAKVETTTVGDLRRRFISDDEFLPHAAKLSFDWERLEKVSIRVNLCCRHGDLHGLNVLLKNRTEPLLIDFALVGMAPASVDPLVLELSLLFHPACREAAAGWPSVDQASNWGNLDAYAAGCPLEAFVRRCRKWAVEVEAGDRGMFATVYAYAVRQLKFADGNHEMAVAVASCAGRRILAS
jgi:CheY-like chemotaxis protein